MPAMPKAEIDDANLNLDRFLPTKIKNIKITP